MSAITSPSDEALLRSAAAGDEEAFTTLYRRRQSGIFRFAMHMCGSVEVAEDVTQEVFVSLIRDASKFDPAKGAVSAYLYGIARNQLKRVIERDRAYIGIDDDVEPVMLSSDNPLGDLTRSETIEGVRKAVLNLPGAYREVVVLCDLEELSYAAAAEVIGVPVGTVRSRLNRARGLLMERLRPASGAGEKGFNARRCFA